MTGTRESSSRFLAFAAYDEERIRVYQAYPEAIAEAALRAGRFVAPFKRERMTWIKPSFLWMMYRSGWGMKPGQERVLAVDITRDGFEWALSRAALTHYSPALHADHEAWQEQLHGAPNRVQWDPDRDVALEPQPWRAIQVGLAAGETVERYVEEWIVGIEDVTALAHEVHGAVAAGGRVRAEALLPEQRPYPLVGEWARRLVPQDA